MGSFDLAAPLRLATCYQIAIEPIAHLSRTTGRPDGIKARFPRARYLRIVRSLKR
jgi:hypothetical protein